eukprot:3070754-Alexandrium_andersonii.AAC.1
MPLLELAATSFCAGNASGFLRLGARRPSAHAARGGTPHAATSCGRRARRCNQASVRREASMPR